MTYLSREAIIALSAMAGAASAARGNIASNAINRDAVHRFNA